MTITGGGVDGMSSERAVARDRVKLELVYDRA